ncbi:MFS transporter [Thermoplasma acidophilum]|nr:MFS transporter [Thermoplasma acidophilum]
MTESWEELKERAYGPMDKQKSKWFNYKMLLLTGGGIFVDGYNIVIISFGLAGIETLFGLQHNAFLVGLIGISVIIGNLVGALLSGYFVDKVGRRTIFIIDLILFVFFAIISGLVTNAYELVVARLLVGLGIGLDYPIATSYLSEYTPINPRGKFLVMNITFFNIAGVVAAIVGYSLLPLGATIAWRYMLMSAAVPAAITIAGRIRTPESPRWLLEHGRKKEAIQAIERVTESTLPDDTQKFIMDSNVKPPVSGYYKELLTKYTKSAIFIGLFYFFFAIAFVNASLYGPSILASFGEAGLIGSSLYWLLFVVGDIICILVIDSFGRRNSTLTGWAGMLITMIILAFAPSNLKLLSLGAFILFAMFQGIGPGSLHMVYSPELFPTRIRATAEGWKQGIGRLGGVLTGLFFPSLVIGDKLLILILTSIAGLVLSILMAPETKRKGLEEISEKDINLQI